MAFEQLKDRIRALGSSKPSAERRAREEPLRAELLAHILAGAFVVLAIQAALFAFFGARRADGVRWFLWWFTWGSLEPLAVLLIAVRLKRRRRIGVAALLVVIALSHIAAFTGVQFGRQYLTGALLALTIIVCGLLVGEYYIWTWTIVCCGVAVWCNLAESAWEWPVTGFWCGMFVATAWLVNLFSRHLERLYEATRVAEEGRRDAIVAERTRFAREIHDSLAQGFTGIVIQLNAAEQRLTADPEQARPYLDRAREVARQSLDDARRSVKALRPGLLANGTLRGAIEQIGSQLTAGSSIQFVLRIEGQSRVLSEEVESQMLRIGQEALSNAVRHARARRVEVLLRYDSGSAALEVRDDGRGIDDASRGRGFGLKSMAERAAQLGGRLDVTPAPGGGTIVRATIPNR